MRDEDRRPAGRPSVPAVLSISEILTCIFRDLDNASRAAAARVCQTWVDVALDVLWEKLESPHPIMALLGPIRFHEDGWDWDTGFPDGDWTRFASYTKRVRSFSYDGRLYDHEGFTEDHLAPDVPAKLLYYVATNHGAYLLPRNRKLQWRASTDNDLQMILPFTSPTLREVDIEAQWEVSSSATSRLLCTLHAVLPHDIVSLRVVPNGEMGRELEEEITRVISIRRNLRVLQLPACLMNNAMFIPNLRVLEAAFDSAWNSDPGAFFLHLSDNCPLVEDLRIIFPSDSMLTVESIYSLFRCFKLRTLDLEYPGRVDLPEKQIREMGRAWRDMEAFNISSRRVYASPILPRNETPLASLVTFAQAFSPKLRKLAVYVNPSNVPLHPTPSICFPNLEFFSVGTSQLDYTEEAFRRVIRFLGTVLPPRIDYIHSDVLSYDWSRSVFKPNEDGRWATSATWNTLSEMLQSYRKAIPMKREGALAS
ncbi:hypothetical protein M407DRAFT_19279 [Tulasnella calospora MUT 4182]|uniref:F-box domain-containing protein n=1 Tax=Tulasnella calospora MUT 4182 TaxID=1051891 RepID=A0A0C3QIC0_9AGAM|nr:hypothetical protein M407DRAFT_19279 [Tulasnella calospora MUT 4182]